MPVTVCDKRHIEYMHFFVFQRKAETIKETKEGRKEEYYFRFTVIWARFSRSILLFVSQ